MTNKYKDCIDKIILFTILFLISFIFHESVLLYISKLGDFVSNNFPIKNTSNIFDVGLIILSIIFLRYFQFSVKKHKANLLLLWGVVLSVYLMDFLYWHDWKFISLSQDDVVLNSDRITKATVSEIENGKRNLSFTTLIDLAKGMKRQPKELLDFDID